MDGKGLLNALILHYADRTQWGRCSAADLLTHAACVVLDMSEEEAIEWVGEDLAEIRANRG